MDYPNDPLNEDTEHGVDMRLRPRRGLYVAIYLLATCYIIAMLWVAIYSLSNEAACIRAGGTMLNLHCVTMRTIREYF